MTSDNSDKEGHWMKEEKQEVVLLWPETLWKGIVSEREAEEERSFETHFHLQGS